jgi:hypothetical protein
VQAESQQTPSTQKPEPHSALDAHAVAFAFAQWPRDVGRLHEKPLPVHAESQQMPPTQLPLAHPFAPVQPLPFGCLSTHAPPLQK